jgi:hypothetical protein
VTASDTATLWISFPGAGDKSVAPFPTTKRANAPQIRVAVTIDASRAWEAHASASGDACQQGERQPEGIEDRAGDKPANDTTASE